ncbi:DMT family transporter [Gottschalkiaceae bacterium SANA]|nr:DMT family transporter [Gottschalkiaceae bacterium SANA]
MILGISLAMTAGILLFGARIVNYRLGHSLGIAGGSFANHWIGTVISALILIVLQIPFIASSEPVAWYAWLGGPIGAAFVMISNLTMGSVSVMISTTLIFIGQVGMGILLDYTITNHSIAPKQLLGAALIFAGILWNQRANRKPEKSS